MTDSLNLIENNLKEGEDLKDKLEEEKIHDKARKDMLKKEKNEIKNDLTEKKENYVIDN